MVNQLLGNQFMLVDLLKLIMEINHLKYLLIFLVLLLSLFSCNSREGVEIMPSLHIYGNGYIDSEGGELIIVVSSPASWKAHVESGVASWLDIKTTSNDSVIVSITPNPAEKYRSAQITIKLDKFDKSGTFQVVQEGKNSDSMPDDPIALGYKLQSSMQGSSILVDKDWTQIHSYMKRYGWDYSEHPNSSDNDHKDGIHCQNIYDDTLKQYVFKLMIHVNPFLDGDRGEFIDRQRNEIKSQTSSNWYKMNGNWNEWQWLEWKFKIPKGFRPSANFCHIHQLKAMEGNNTLPSITITLRGNNDGTNRRVQIKHDGDISSTSKGTIVDNVPLEEFENEWVQVQEEVYYTYNGFYRIKITRIRDQKVLMDYSIDNIDMWRKGATNIRNKFGIYRSFGKTLSGPEDRPSNGIKDESLFLGDFYIYEKNTNFSPRPHD